MWLSQSSGPAVGGRPESQCCRHEVVDVEAEREAGQLGAQEMGLR